MLGSFMASEVGGEPFFVAGRNIAAVTAESRGGVWGWGWGWFGCGLEVAIWCS